MFHLQLFSYLLIMKQDSVSLHKNKNFMWPSLRAQTLKRMELWLFFVNVWSHVSQRLDRQIKLIYMYISIVTHSAATPSVL